MTTSALWRKTCALGDFALELLSPRSCAACAGPRAGKPPFCRTCGETPPAVPCTFEGAPLVVAGAYAAPLSLAIRRFKFEGHAELARDLVRLLEQRVELLGLGREATFVPVPLHRTRLVERGYNQAALLASALARRSGRRFAPLALERRQRTEQQARLGRSERERNVRAAFAVRAGSVPSVSVLVDDVVTTGHTAMACLRALRAAGSEVLAVVALARADSLGW